MKGTFIHVTCGYVSYAEWCILDETQGTLLKCWSRVKGCANRNRRWVNSSPPQVGVVKHAADVHTHAFSLLSLYGPIRGDRCRGMINRTIEWVSRPHTSSQTGADVSSHVVDLDASREAHLVLGPRAPLSSRGPTLLTKSTETGFHFVFSFNPLCLKETIKMDVTLDVDEVCNTFPFVFLFLGAPRSPALPHSHEWNGLSSQWRLSNIK